MMTPDRIVLSRNGLRITLAQPGRYYQGTRFDWSGVFCGIECNGNVYCDKWFDVEDPLRHDNVCGPSEEFFGCLGYDSAKIGDGFLKVGVGLLKKDSDAPYDWFHRYEILDPGRRNVEIGLDSAVFTHEMPGVYSYVKTVELTGPDSFRISHSLTTVGRMHLTQYCHNFFTFGLKSVGAERSVEFAVPLSGIEMRCGEPYCNKIDFDSNRVWVKDTILPGEKCYLDNICASPSEAYGFVLKAGDSSVQVGCTLPMAASVLWSNNRVFCPEPYVDLETVPQVPLEWNIDYKLF